MTPRSFVTPSVSRFRIDRSPDHDDYGGKQTFAAPLQPAPHWAPDPKSETHGLSSVHATVQTFSIDEHPPPSETDSVKHVVPLAHEASGKLQDWPGEI